MRKGLTKAGFIVEVTDRKTGAKMYLSSAPVAPVTNKPNRFLRLSDVLKWNPPPTPKNTLPELTPWLHFKTPDEGNERNETAAPFRSSPSLLLAKLNPFLSKEAAQAAIDKLPKNKGLSYEIIGVGQ